MILILPKGEGCVDLPSVCKCGNQRESIVSRTSTLNRKKLTLDKIHYKQHILVPSHCGCVFVLLPARLSQGTISPDLSSSKQNYRKSFSGKVSGHALRIRHYLELEFVSGLRPQPSTAAQGLLLIGRQQSTYWMRATRI